MSNIMKYGLFCGDQNIPLQYIDCQVKAGELISEVHIKQVYEIDISTITTTTTAEDTSEESDDNSGMEVKFHFPLETGATVHEFCVDVDHLLREDGQWHNYDTIRGRVKPKQEAREEYEDAIVEGRSSGFLMEKRAHSNEFTVMFMVRHPPPSSGVVRQRLTVHMAYVCELDLVISDAEQQQQQQQQSEEKEEEEDLPSSLDNIWCRLMLPLTMYPKYEQTSSMPRVDDNAEPRPEIEYADASKVAYRFGVTVEFTEQCRVTSVQCPSHSVQVSEDRRRVALRDNDRVPVDRDFRLYFRTEQLVTSLEQSNSLLNENSSGDGSSDEKREESVVIEEISVAQANGDKDKQKYAVMLPIVAPTLLEEHEGDEWYNSELIFVVDCSGSMSGSPIREAGRTLKLFLQSLPLEQGIRFNVLRFGSTFETLFKNSSEPLTAKTLQQAMQVAQNLSANLGGTELYAPLAHLMGAKGPEGYSRQLFILTDGEIFNTEQTLELVRDNRANVRVYTFGIGSCDINLVQGLANAGNGYAEFIGHGEKIDAKVMGQLKRALRPTWVNCTVEWGNTLSKSSIKPCFTKIQPLYYGTRHLLFAFLDNLPKDVCQVLFKADTGRKNCRQFTKSFTLRPDNVQSGKTIHALGAAALIKEMEEFGKPDAYGLKTRNDVKEQIKLLSLRYQILSSECSFVAISEKFAQDAAQQKPLKQVNVPSALPADKMSSMARRGAMPGVMLRQLSLQQPLTMSSYGLNTAAPMLMKESSAPRSRGLGSVLGSVTSFFKGSASRSTMASPPASVTLCHNALSAPAPPPPPSTSYEMEFDEEEVEEQMERELAVLSKKKKMKMKMKKSLAQSTSPLASSPSSSPTFTLDRILFSQDPSGFWTWESVCSLLAALLGSPAAVQKQQQQLEQIMKELSIKDKNCLATAVVLALLEQHFADQKVTWDLISRKGRGWIRRQIKQQQQPLIDKVKAILATEL